MYLHGPTVNTYVNVMSQFKLLNSLSTVKEKSRTGYSQVSSCEYSVYDKHVLGCNLKTKQECNNFHGPSITINVASFV